MSSNQSTNQQSSISSTSSSANEQPYLGGPDYTDSEKQYVKDNHKSEYHFLKDHGLNIYKEDHREEGRAILRTMREYGYESKPSEGSS